MDFDDFTIFFQRFDIPAHRIQRNVKLAGYLGRHHLVVGVDLLNNEIKSFLLQHTFEILIFAVFYNPSLRIKADKL